MFKLKLGGNFMNDVKNGSNNLSKRSYKKLADLCPVMEEKDLFTVYNYLKDEIVANPIFNKVMDRVGKYSDFFVAPASCKYHLNVPLGLFRHSLGVTFRLLALDSAYGIIDSANLLEVVLAAMLHDLGKAGQVQINSIKSDEVISSPYYLKKSLKTKPGEFKYERNKDKNRITRMSVPLGSLHFISVILSDIWKPSPEIWAAIAYHDGMYVKAGAEVAQAETPLGVALHNADYFQARLESNWELGTYFG
jgi:hypothetical protein